MMVFIHIQMEPKMSLLHQLPFRKHKLIVLTTPKDFLTHMNGNMLHKDQTKEFIHGEMK